MTHQQSTLEEQSAAGLSPETIRISVGVEDPDDLICNLGQSLNKAIPG